MKHRSSLPNCEYANTLEFEKHAVMLSFEFNKHIPDNPTIGISLPASETAVDIGTFPPLLLPTLWRGYIGRSVTSSWNIGRSVNNESNNYTAHAELCNGHIAWILFSRKVLRELYSFENHKIIGAVMASFMGVFTECSLWNQTGPGRFDREHR